MDSFLKSLTETPRTIFILVFAVFIVQASVKIHESMLRIEAAMWTIGCQSQGLTPVMCEFLRKEAVK